jgi:uncharacterized protein YbjT (DUF2867 family)
VPCLLDLREQCGPRRRPAFESDITGRHELGGPDSTTLGEANRRLATVRGKRIAVLHPPLSTMRLAGRFSPAAEELAGMFALFDAVGYATDPAQLRDIFGVEELTIEGSAKLVFGQERFG